MDLNFIRQNLRSFLRIPESFTASASLPTAALGGHPPEMSFTRPAPVAPVAPVPSATATAPQFRRAPVGTGGLTAYQEKIRVEARLKTEFGLHEKLATAGMDSTARRKVLGDFDRFVAKAAPAPATDDDGTPAKTALPDSENPAGIDSILSQLLDLLTELKNRVATTTDDDDEAVAALGEMAKGRKLTASRALMALTQKLCQRPKLSPTARTARGFSKDDSVKALQACLHPRTSPAVRASFALAPVAGGPAQPAAVASQPGSRDRVQALRAEIAQLDREQRKQFSNERNAKHAQVSAQLRAEIKKLRAS